MIRGFLFTLLVVLAAPVRGVTLQERLPADSKLLGHIDVQALRAAKFIDLAALSASAPSRDSSGVASWLVRAGLDPARDVDSLAFGIQPSRAVVGATTSGNVDFALLASGRFDAARLEKQALAEGGARVMLGASKDRTGLSVLRLPGAGAVGPAAYLSFLDDGVLLVASEAATEAVQRGSKKAPTLLRETKGTVPPDALAWIVADPSGAAAAGANVPGDLRQFAAWVESAQQLVRIRGLGTASSDAAAGQLASVVQMLSAVGGMSEPAFAGVKVTADGPRVRLDWLLTSQQVMAFLAPRARKAGTVAP